MERSSLKFYFLNKFSILIKMLNNISSDAASSSYADTQLQNDDNESPPTLRAPTNRDRINLSTRQNNQAFSEKNFLHDDNKLRQDNSLPDFVANLLISLNSTSDVKQKTSKEQLIVSQTLKIVRSKYYEIGLKSSNKVRNSRPEDERARQIKANNAVVQSRENKDLVQSALTAKAHNCHELTVLACHELAKAGHSPTYLGIGSHSAAALGINKDSKFNSSLTEWPEYIYICDPWSNIACRAQNYPEIFEEKMKKWANQKKLINFKGEWMLADHPTHLKSVLNSEIFPLYCNSNFI